MAEYKFELPNKQVGGEKKAGLLYEKEKGNTIVNAYSQLLLLL